MSSTAALQSAPRVLLVLNRFRPMIGGAERQCELLIEQLASDVHWVAVLTHRYDEALTAHEHSGPVEVERLGKPSAKGVAPFSFYCALAKRLWLMRNKYDIVHCHTAGMTGLLSASLGRLLSRPVLLKLTAAGELQGQLALPHLGASLATRFKSVVRRGIARFALRGSGTHVVALTLEGGNEARAAGAMQVHVVPNGVDADRCGSTLRTSYSGVVRFGYCGRLTEEKGTHVLADAFDVIGARRRDASLTVAGSGYRQLRSSEERLRDVAHRWPTHVDLVGAIGDTYAFFGGLDAYVSASTYEGLPNAVLEALAYGLPCVLSDIDAHRELVRLNPDASIRLFASGDVTACVDAIETTVRNWPVAPSKLSPELHISRVAQRYLCLYTMMTARSLGNPSL